MGSSDHTVLPATHTWTIYLPLLPSRKASPPFGWYSLRLPTKGWPGWVNLDGWLHIEINVPHRESNLDTVTHPCTNRARRRLTLRVCVCVCVSAQKLRNFWSEIDETWHKYVLRWILEVFRFRRHLTLTFVSESYFDFFWFRKFRTTSKLPVTFWCSLTR